MFKQHLLTIFCNERFCEFNLMETGFHTHYFKKFLKRFLSHVLKTFYQKRSFTLFFRMLIKRLPSNICKQRCRFLRTLSNSTPHDMPKSKK